MLFNKFFSDIVDTYLSSEDMARQSCAMVPKWRFFASCISKFFPIVDTCLNCEDIARQSCAMVPRWRFLSTFLRPVFAASRIPHISDMHSKFALRPHHVWKYGRHPKNFLSSNISSTCPHNMVNFGLLAAEIVSLVWGTPSISTGFAFWLRYCTAL